MSVNVIEDKVNILCEVKIMGNVSYWYKKTLQSFADAITYGEYDEITKSVLEEESEETLENFILEYRQNININEFYFNAGIVTNQIVSETRTIGNDSFNAAMFALCNFMELIGLESEEDNIDMTNYERIKKMNVPEMARLLESIHSYFDEHIRTINGDNVFDSFDDIEEWLESEVKDND